MPSDTPLGLTIRKCPGFWNLRARLVPESSVQYLLLPGGKREAQRGKFPSHPESLKGFPPKLPMSQPRALRANQQVKTWLPATQPPAAQCEPGLRPGFPFFFLSQSPVTDLLGLLRNQSTNAYLLLHNMRTITTASGPRVNFSTFSKLGIDATVSQHQNYMFSRAALVKHAILRGTLVVSFSNDSLRHEECKAWLRASQDFLNRGSSH